MVSSTLRSGNRAAKEITKLHSEIVDSLQTTLDKGLRIGELLAEQKAALPHGEFGPWVTANLPFALRTGQRYMRLCQERDRLKSDNVSHLASAYKLLTDERQPACGHYAGQKIDNLRRNCEKWWDHFYSAVVHYHTHGISSDTIAYYCGQPVEAVDVLLNPPDPADVLPREGFVGDDGEWAEYLDYARSAIRQWKVTACCDAVINGSEGDNAEKIDGELDGAFEHLATTQAESQNRLRLLIATDHARYLMRIPDPHSGHIPSYGEVARPWIEAIIEIQDEQRTTQCA